MKLAEFLDEYLEWFSKSTPTYIQTETSRWLSLRQNSETETAYTKAGVQGRRAAGSALLRAPLCVPLQASKVRSQTSGLRGTQFGNHLFIAELPRWEIHAWRYRILLLEGTSAAGFSGRLSAWLRLLPRMYSVRTVLLVRLTDRHRFADLNIDVVYPSRAQHQKGESQTRPWKALPPTR